MAKLKEGSTIVKKIGEQIIATLNDLKKVEDNTYEKSNTPPENTKKLWLDTSK